MKIEDLLERASKDLKSLNELKNLAVKFQLYELGAKCREIEKELFPITEEEIEAKNRYNEIELVLRMVGVGFNGEKVYYKIDKTLELFRKKKENLIPKMLLK